MSPTKPSPAQELGVICIVALGLGVASDFLFYGKALGISWPIFTGGIAFVGLVVSVSGPAVRSREWVVALVAALAAAALVAVRDNETHRTVAMGCTAFLLLLAWALRRGALIPGDGPLGYAVAAARAGEDVPDDLGRIGTEVRGLASLRREAWREILTGALIALPFLVVFAMLFAFADSIFMKYIVRLIENIGFESLWRLTRVGLIAALLAGALAALRRPASAGDPDSGGWLVLRVKPLQAATVLALVNGLFFLFIVVQMTYLFGGEENIRREGLTYAEYARQGFGELCAVAVISFFLIRSIERGTRDAGGGHDASFRLLSATLVLQLLIILVSAHRRLALYEAAYGFTLTRLHAHVFIAWLGVLTMLLSARIVSRRPGPVYARAAFWMTVVFITGLGAANPDRIVARHNLARLELTGKYDWPYLMTELSADAMPDLVAALDRLPAADRDVAAGNLAVRYREWQADPAFHRWQSLNLGRRRALAALAARFGHSAVDRSPGSAVPPSAVLPAIH